MSIPKPPCIIDKCITYPICKYKPTIRCDKLAKYIKDIIPHYTTVNMTYEKQLLFDTIKNSYFNALMIVVKENLDSWRNS